MPKMTADERADIRVADKYDIAEEIIEVERTTTANYLTKMSEGMGREGFMESRDTLRFVADKIRCGWHRLCPGDNYRARQRDEKIAAKGRGTK